MARALGWSVGLGLVLAFSAVHSFTAIVGLAWLGNQDPQAKNLKRKSKINFRSLSPEPWNPKTKLAIAAVSANHRISNKDLTKQTRGF